MRLFSNDRSNRAAVVNGGSPRAPADADVAGFGTEAYDRHARPTYDRDGKLRVLPYLSLASLVRI